MIFSVQVDVHVMDAMIAGIVIMSVTTRKQIRIRSNAFKWQTHGTIHALTFVTETAVTIVFMDMNWKCQIAHAMRIANVRILYFGGSFAIIFVW